MLFRVPKLFRIFCPVSRCESSMQGPDIKKYMESSGCLGGAQLNCYSISSVPVRMESLACIYRALWNFQYLAPKYCWRTEWVFCVPLSFQKFYDMPVVEHRLVKQCLSCTGCTAPGRSSLDLWIYQSMMGSGVAAQPPLLHHWPPASGFSYVMSPAQRKMNKGKLGMFLEPWKGCLQSWLGAEPHRVEKSSCITLSVFQAQNSQLQRQGDRKCFQHPDTRRCQSCGEAGHEQECGNCGSVLPGWVLAWPVSLSQLYTSACRWVKFLAQFVTPQLEVTPPWNWTWGSPTSSPRCV